MISEDLKYKILSFDDDLQKGKNLFEEKEALLRKFINDFPILGINDLSFDQYVIGHGNHSAFCHRLERELGKIGGMRGSNSSVFGLYFGKLGKDKVKKDRFTKKYGSTKELALKNILTEITNLLIAGGKNDLKVIENSKIAELFKYKLLGTYFPSKYLNLYSYKHLDFFITMLDIEFNATTFIEKQQLLFDLRDNTPIMNKWSNIEYNFFLYKNWRPPSDKTKLQAKAFFDENFIFTPEIVDLEILPLVLDGASFDQNEKSGKPDYKKIYERNRKHGKLGEMIVMQHENEILGKYNLKANHISLIDDFKGYDIESFEMDGTPKLIEVKSTTGKVGVTNFIISSHELERAKKLLNYHIYIVFEVNTKTPKIWKLGNPFINNPENVLLTPINYAVFINSKAN